MVPTAGGLQPSRCLEGPRLVCVWRNAVCACVHASDVDRRPAEWRDLAREDHEYEQDREIQDRCEKEPVCRRARPPDCEPYSVAAETKTQEQGSDTVEHARFS